MRPVSDQTVLVTGSTDGHGRHVARELAARGATVLVHGRDRERAEALARELDAPPPLLADLASLDEVRQLAAAVPGDLDALVNNAGIISDVRRTSADGFELTFAVNHLAHVLLTSLLLDRLRPPARIVNVASLGQAPIDFDDLMLESGYDAYRAYAQSKLAQVMFTIDLAERLDPAEITVNSLHPATFMDTTMVRTSFGTPHSTVEEGGDATLRLLVDPALDDISGRFYDGVRRSGVHPQADDPDARRRLWELSAELTGARFP